MIKIQRLNYKFLGLLGSAALAIGLEMVLEHFIGSYFSTAPVCAVLLFCIAKTTGTTRFFDTDVIFTVVVAFALTFCMNLFLLGALMDNLRPSARTDDEIEESLERLDKELQTVVVTNQQMTLVQATNKPLTNVVSSKTPVEKTGSTNTANPSTTKPSATTKKGSQPKPPPSPVEIVKSFSLKGVVRSSDKSMATINTGTKTYMIGIGESLTIESAKTIVDFRCEEIGEDSVTLSVAGERVQLFLR